MAWFGFHLRGRWSVSRTDPLLDTSVWALSSQQQLFKVICINDSKHHISGNSAMALYDHFTKTESKAKCQVQLYNTFLEDCANPAPTELFSQCLAVIRKAQTSTRCVEGCLYDFKGCQVNNSFKALKNYADGVSKIY